jgi:hypothetical protein
MNADAILRLVAIAPLNIRRMRPNITVHLNPLEINGFQLSVTMPETGGSDFAATPPPRQRNVRSITTSSRRSLSMPATVMRPGDPATGEQMEAATQPKPGNAQSFAPVGVMPRASRSGLESDVKSPVKRLGKPPRVPNGTPIIDTCAPPMAECRDWRWPHQRSPHLRISP